MTNSLRILYLLAAAVAVPAAFAACDLPTFGGARLFPAANQSEVPAIGDFNGDGIADVAVLNVSGSISILLGNGDGTFKTGANYNLTNPFYIVTADFNGDGKLDLAISGNFQILVMLGNGDGTFQPGIATSISGAGIAVGDFNGDGKPDLAVLTEPADILLGKGDGTFQTPIVSAGPVQGAQEIVVGDFNRDGKLDVIVGGVSGSILIMLGDGKGNLAPPVTFSTGTQFILSGMTVGDFNGDHIVDVVTVNGLANSASVLIGNGDGTFQNPVILPAGTQPTSAAIADFTGDGIPDLAVSNEASFTVLGTISLFPGNGDGTFQQPIQLNPTGQVDWALATADFNGDTVPDLLLISTVTNQPTQVGVMLGTPSGMIQSPRSYAAGATPRVPVLADFNGDGVLDIAVANAGLILSGGLSSNLSVLLGNPDGTFQPAVNYPTGFGAKSLAAGDLNGDGKPDLVVANLSLGNLQIFLGNGDGTFQNPTTVGGLFAAYYVALGDFNNDGKLDAAVVSITGISILLGNGDGTFHAGASLSIPFCPGCGQGPVTVADLNGDGKLDVILSNGDIDTTIFLSQAGMVTVFLGNGDGSFKSGVNYTIGTNATSAAVGDLNGDGRPDLIVSDGGKTGAVAVLLGNGDGTFQNAVRYASGAPLTYVAMADVNGDGSPDVVAASNTGKTVTVFLSNGDGTVRNEIAYGAGGSPPSLAIGDLNGDGKPDLVISDDQAGNVLTLINTYAPGSTNSVCVPAALASN